MKTKLLFYLVFSVVLAFGQNPIPNPGFETWSNGMPTSWTTNNLISIATPVLQSNSAHAGTFAARLEIVNAFGQAYPPVLTILNPTAINQSYGSFSFYYKCSLTSDDGLAIDVNLKDSGTSVAAATGTIESGSNTSVYTLKTLPFFYFGGSPNEFDISFVLGSSTTSSTMTIGSYVIIDDLSFGTPVGDEEFLNEPSLSLGGVFPNPVHGMGSLPFTLSESGSVHLEICSLDGKKLFDVLHTELTQGSYKADLDAGELAPGVYLCKMSAENQVIYSKILVN